MGATETWELFLAHLCCEPGALEELFAEQLLQFGSFRGKPLKDVRAKLSAGPWSCKSLSHSIHTHIYIYTYIYYIYTWRERERACIRV